MNHTRKLYSFLLLRTWKYGTPGMTEKISELFKYGNIKTASKIIALYTGHIHESANRNVAHTQFSSLVDP